MRRAIRLIGKLLFWGVVVAGLAAAGALLLITRHIDDAVRAEVQRIFAEHYEGLHVSVRSAQRVEGQGLFVRGLSIKDPRLDEPSSELLYVDEVFMACQSTIDELMRGGLQVDHVQLRRLSLKAMRQADGSWSTAQLLPLPDTGGAMPQTTIEDGAIELIDAQRPSPTKLTLRRINVEITPGQPANASGQRSRHDILNIQGNLSSDSFKQVDIRGWLAPAAGQWSLAGTVEQLNISPQSWQTLPGPLSQHGELLGQLFGKADLTFAVSHGCSDSANRVAHAATTLPCKFDVQGNVYDARFEDPRLPFPLRDITAQVRLANDGLHIENLIAQGGGASLHVNLHRQGWAATSPLQLTAKARQFHVDDSVADVLPAPLAATWRRFRPSGKLDADVVVAYDGQKWTPELTVQCLEMSFLYEDFPYPIAGAQGTITLREDLLEFSLSALAANQPLTMKGRFEQPMTAPFGWMQYACEQPVPIDGRLLAALDTDALRSSRDLMLAMKARGGLSSTGRFELVRLPDGGSQINEHVIMRLHDGGVEYEKFPYPLSHITGEIELWNGQFTFRNLQGQNDSGQVTCNGTYLDTGGAPQLVLNFICRDLPLEEELRRALSPSLQEVWASLRPQGTIDRLNMQLRYSPATEQMQVDIAAVKWPEQHGRNGQPISMLPRAFPYRLNQLTGEVRYRDGYVEMTNVTAAHGDSQVTLSGFCQMADDGSWRLQFSQFDTAGLSVDRDLIAALPEECAAGVAPLNVRGPVTLSGAVEFRRGPRIDDPISSDWDVTIDLENGNLNCGVGLSHIHGAVRLIGSHNGENFYSRGELSLDSLMYKGFQFTRVTGPIWIDRGRIAMGAWANPPPQDASARKKPPRRIQAMLLGGTVSGDLHVSLADDKYFTLHAQLDQADLSQYARELLPNQKRITGQASGTLRLSGSSRGADTLRGDGRLWLRNANIYELPVMVSLVKILKIKPLDNTAFTSSDVDYRINGEDIYLDRIVFKGDAISLKGSGEVNLDRRVNLKFYTLIGDESRRIPVIWPLLAGASRRILMIEVTGSLDQPVTTKNVLPGLNSTIERLFSEELRAAEGPDRPQFQR